LNQNTLILTTAEENYLKAIFKISESDKKSVSTNAISAILKTTPASVTDMVRKLAEKEYINYTKYKGVSLTNEGNKIAIELIRRHRLWEVFLVDKLRFSWENIHEIAEQLEHINNAELISRLDAYLDYPKFDPHGEPIPNFNGKFTLRNQLQLSEISSNQVTSVMGVRDSSKPFLKHLTSMGIKIGTNIIIQERTDYDGALKIYVDKRNTHTISEITAQNILVKKI
jgi:DtxR family transcriptional regulator, Mn-dependent transcriptional regulator